MAVPASDPLATGAGRAPLGPGSVSIVIPVYNGAQTLAPLLARLSSALTGLGRPFEVVCVDDGSPDGSWAALLELTSQYRWLRIHRLMRNFGQHNATLCGIRDARGEFTVTMDDDLQHRPETIAVLLARLEEGYDVVYGSPEQERHGLWRDLASQITKLALKSVLGASTARQVSGFRAIRTQVRGAFADFRGAFVSIDVLLTWGTTKFASCRVPHDERQAGRSNYTFRKLVAHAFNMMTGFSTMPLQVASIIGFGAVMFGMLLLALVLYRYAVYGVTVPGFTFLASVVCVFSGAQMFTLGIMGEYLARMHFRTMDRPVYAIAATVDRSGRSAETLAR